MNLLWPYFAIFGFMLCIGLGIPPFVPEEAGIIGSATFTVTQELYWWLSWPACMGGILLADLILYGTGRFGRSWLFNLKWVNRYLPQRKRDKLEDGFRQHGIKIMMTSRLLPGVRSGVFMMAGAVHYPFLRFIIADGLFLIFGAGFFFFGAFFFSRAMGQIVDGVHLAQHWLMIAIVLAGAAAVAFFYFTRWRHRNDDAADDDEVAVCKNQSPGNAVVKQRVGGTP